MKTKLQKWENSIGRRILSNFLKSLNLKTNDKVNMEYENDKIINTRHKEKKISLEERFAEYEGENLSKVFVWDEVKGKEIW